MDEQAQTSEAPDGAELTTQEPATAPTELSADMREAIHRRQTMAVKLAERDAEVADLKAKLRAATLPRGEVEDPKPSEAPDGATLASVMAKLVELDGRITGRQAQESRAAVVTGALDQVPELHRPQADLVLAGLEARGTIKLGAETTSDDLVNALHEHSPELLRAQGRRVAPQVTAGGEVRWDRYQSISEVPKNLIGQCPDKEWARLTKGGGSSRPMQL